MERFDEFMQERHYLLGVSKKNIDYYRWGHSECRPKHDYDPALVHEPPDVGGHGAMT